MGSLDKIFGKSMKGLTFIMAQFGLYYGSVWPLLWLSLAFIMAQFGLYYGSVWPLLWLRLTFIMAQFGLYYGSVWPLLWLSLAFIMAQFGLYYGPVCKSGNAQRGVGGSHLCAGCGTSLVVLGVIREYQLFKIKTFKLSFSCYE